MTRALVLLASLTIAGPAMAAEVPPIAQQQSPWERPQPPPLQAPPPPARGAGTTDWTAIGAGNYMIVGGQVAMTSASLLSLGGYIVSVIAVGNQDVALFEAASTMQVVGLGALLVGAGSYAIGVPIGVAGLGPLATRATQAITWTGVGLGLVGISGVAAGLMWNTIQPQGIGAELNATLPPLMITLGALFVAFGGYLLEPGARSIRRAWRGRPNHPRRPKTVSLALAPTGVYGTF